KESNLYADAVNGKGLIWNHFSHEGISYTRGISYLDKKNEKLIISLIKKTESLDFGIQALKQTLMWIVPLMILILVIIGKLFADRVILKPVKKLTTLSSSLAAGNYITDENLKTSGEFALLLEAFNSMSEKIQERETELINAQIRMTDIIENAPSIIYMKDLQGRYLVANSNFLQLIGKTREETLGTTDFDHFPEDIASKIRANDQMLNKIGVPIDFEEALPQKNGELKFYHSVKFPLQDSEGKTVSFCGISTDITERKRIEKNLLLSRMVIEQINEAIVITDLKGKIVDANKAYEKLTGYEKRELIGKSPNIVKSGFHDDGFYKNLWDKLIRNGSWSGEINDKAKTGEIFTAWMAISTVQDTYGNPAYYVSTYSQVERIKNI
ncbi:MAG: PAS domain S-box protein, partial [Draconibacterium sp.]|nr:PAS domain S-box protein [Draconibacterium sp.]